MNVYACHITAYLLKLYVCSETSFAMFMTHLYMFCSKCALCTYEGLMIIMLENIGKRSRLLLDRILEI